MGPAKTIYALAPRVAVPIQNPQPLRTPLRVVPISPPIPESPPPAIRGFTGRLGGAAFSVSLLWAGKGAYDAIRAVPSQLPWMPGPSVAPEIWRDPKRVLVEAHKRFAYIATPQLNQLHNIREKQSVPMRHDPLREPHERTLMVQDEHGNWVQIPLDGQETGALLIGDMVANEFPRKPLHQRASDELQLIEIELGRRSFTPEFPKTDADKNWFEQYADYIRDLAEALRKWAKGEYAPLPVFIFERASQQVESTAILHRGIQIMNSNSTTADTSSEVNSGATSMPKGNVPDSPEYEIDKGVLTARYNGYSGDYEGHNKKMGAAMNMVVREYLNPYITHGTTLLDVAGGDGLATSLLDPDKVKITITDISQGMLDAAKPRRPNVIGVINADFDSQLPFEDDSFNFTTCISALEFARSIGFTLSELFRVTKRGGFILFTTDHFDETSKVQNGKVYVHDSRGFFSRRYTTDEVAKIIAAMGGRVIRQGIHNAYRLEDQWIKYDYFLVTK